MTSTKKAAKLFKCIQFICDCLVDFIRKKRLFKCNCMNTSLILIIISFQTLSIFKTSHPIFGLNILSMLWMHFEWEFPCIEWILLWTKKSHANNMQILMEEDNIHFDFPPKHIGQSRITFQRNYITTDLIRKKALNV